MANAFERATTWLSGFFRPDVPAPQTSFPALPPAQRDEVPSPENAPLAPYPLVDRYPTVIGSNLTFQHISSAMRICTTGYRREWVDLLDELLEREGQGFAVLSKRILIVAGARLELTPAKLPEDSPEKDAAKEIAEFCTTCLEGISDFEQSLAALQWAVYHGVSCAEIGWRREQARWVPKRLHFVNSRRIAYPDPTSWKVHIWDQGSVRFWGDAISPTAAVGFGLVVDDYPGKFIVHTPQLRGNYPLRDGLGRELAYLFAQKGMTMRGAGQYIEKFGKPWPILSYSTTTTGTPRMATQADIDAAQNVAAAFGGGGAASATLPDSVTTSLQGPGLTGHVALSHTEWLEYLDGQISKVVLGDTLTTDAGKRGNSGATEIHKQGEMEKVRYDANCLSETLRRDLIEWVVRLNFPNKVHLCPRVTIHVDAKPDPQDVMDLAVKGAGVGMPVDADELAHLVGLPLIEQKKPDDAPADWAPRPRRLAPLKQVDISDLDDGFAHPPAPAHAPPPFGGANGVQLPPRPSAAQPPTTPEQPPGAATN